MAYNVNIMFKAGTLLMIAFVIIRLVSAASKRSSATVRS
jgi:hypothetical protein